MYYTTIEQSKKLLELGLKPESADMYYEMIHGDKYPQLVRVNLTNRHWMHLCPGVMMPCWSLGALINLMPSMIYKGGETFTLRMYKDVVYHVCYKSHYHLDEVWFSKENLLDAAFEMVCWLLENGYIKKGE